MSRTAIVPISLTESYFTPQLCSMFFEPRQRFLRETL
jgi:hypothetical protein